MSALAWGRHYLCVSPEHFRIEYKINPFMDPSHQPDRGRARKQWDALVDTLRAEGAQVEVLPGRPDSPDMVYAQNLGLVWTAGGSRSGDSRSGDSRSGGIGSGGDSRKHSRSGGPESPRHVLLSTMRHEQRRNERLSAQRWFVERGYQVHTIEPAFESGDAFWWRGELIVGYGPRTDLAAVEQIGELLGVPTRAIHTVHPAMFHLDLSFCPLTEEAALIAPEAFDRESADLLIDLVPDPLVVSIEDALAFAANSVMVGDALIGDGISPLLVAQLAERGIRVVQVDLSEFQLSGGSARCMTNPLDIVLAGPSC